MASTRASIASRRKSGEQSANRVDEYRQESVEVSGGASDDVAQ